MYLYILAVAKLDKLVYEMGNGHQISKFKFTHASVIIIRH